MINEIGLRMGDAQIVLYSYFKPKIKDESIHIRAHRYSTISTWSSTSSSWDIGRQWPYY